MGVTSIMLVPALLIPLYDRMEDGPDEDVADGKEMTPEVDGVPAVSGTEDLGSTTLLVLMWIGCFVLCPSLTLVGTVEGGCSTFVRGGTVGCCAAATGSCSGSKLWARWC